MTDALTHGVHHVGLAVRDLDEATGFFCGTLGFKEVARNDAYPAVFVSDGVVTLTIWRVTDPGNAVPFNRKTNIGLHHLALAVADEAALATVHERVSKHPGVMLEFTPEPVRPGSTTHHFICAIPGGTPDRVRDAPELTVQRGPSGSLIERRLKRSHDAQRRRASSPSDARSLRAEQSA